MKVIGNTLFFFEQSGRFKYELVNIFDAPDQKPCGTPIIY